jgi:hypothetical protein
MFCTFTTEQGALIIRSEDIRSLTDRVDGCAVMWVIGDQVYNSHVQGTAQENLDRLRDEEIKALDAAQRLQQRAADKAALSSIPRGRPR